ncbi:SigB/SigF/SigG family RNA polymerase sigma factor (plasmid) [Streptomyces sp. CA-294286]|uniref:SigB/SigF/SigG family RNA polymerase sigma factor n=1 Tax=Streptomyces sp. CA-294286 TaxID=3240070 RepID=UPI003D8BDA92
MPVIDHCTPGSTPVCPHDGTPDTDAAFRRAAALPAGSARDAVLEDITRQWLPMSERLAARYRDRGERLEDLRQVAALGLVKAVTRYDIGLGVPFLAFAVPTISGEIKRHFRDHTWSVRVPRKIQELRRRVRVAHRELAERSATEPTTADIAAHTGLTEHEVREGSGALHAYAALSLEKALAPGDDDFSLRTTLGQADPRYDRAVDREAVRHILRTLPAREKHILYLRFFADMSQSSIAAEVGLSQMHVSRLIARTCEDIRAQVLSEGPASSAYRDTQRARGIT